MKNDVPPPNAAGIQSEAILAAPVISSTSLAELESAGFSFDLAVVFAEINADGVLRYIGERDQLLAHLPTAVVLFCQAPEGDGYRDFKWAQDVFQREDFEQVTHLGLVTFDRWVDDEMVYAPVMPRPQDLEIWSQEYPDLAWLFPWSLAEDVRQLYAQSKILTDKPAYFRAEGLDWWEHPFGGGAWQPGVLERTPDRPLSLSTMADISIGTPGDTDGLTSGEGHQSELPRQHALIFAEGGGTRAHSLDLEAGQVELITAGGDYPVEVGPALLEYSDRLSMAPDALARELHPKQVNFGGGNSEQRIELLKRVLQANPSMRICTLHLQPVRFENQSSEKEALLPYLDAMRPHQSKLREICVSDASMTSEDLQLLSNFKGLKQLTLIRVDLSRCCVELGLEANPELRLSLDQCAGLTPDWLDFVSEQDKKRVQVVYSRADLSWFLAHSRSERAVSVAAEQLGRGANDTGAWLAGVAFSPFYPWAQIFSPSLEESDLPTPGCILDRQDPWSGCHNEGGLERIRNAARAALESWPEWEVAKSRIVPEIARTPEEIADARHASLGFDRADSISSASDRWSAILGQRSFLWDVNPLATITINGLPPADHEISLVDADAAEALVVRIKCLDVGQAFQVDLAPAIETCLDTAVEVFWALGQAYPRGIEHLTVVVEDSNGSIDPTFMLRGLPLVGEIKRLKIEFPNGVLGIADLAEQAGVAQDGRQLVSTPKDMAWLTGLKGLEELSLSGDAEALSAPLSPVDFERCLPAGCRFIWDPKLFAITEMNLPTCSQCGGREFRGSWHSGYAPESGFYEVHHRVRPKQDTAISSGMTERLEEARGKIKDLTFDCMLGLEEGLEDPYKLVDGQLASGAQIEIEEMHCVACGTSADGDFTSLASKLSRDFDEEYHEVKASRTQFAARRASFMRRPGPNPDVFFEGKILDPDAIEGALRAHWRKEGMKCPDCASPVEVSLFRTWEDQRSEKCSGEFELRADHPITTSVTWSASSTRGSDLVPSELWASEGMMDVRCSKGCWVARGVPIH